MLTRQKQLSVKCPGHVLAPNGQALMAEQSVVYHGGFLHNDGQVQHELSRRVGLATAQFRLLEAVWRHSSMTTGRKVAIFNSCVLSVLAYGLRATWLTTASLQRVDGFHGRCLRQIMKIPLAYYSWVSNMSIDVHLPFDRCDLRAWLASTGGFPGATVCRTPSADLGGRTAQPCDLEPGGNLTAVLRSLGSWRPFVTEPFAAHGFHSFIHL